MKELGFGGVKLTARTITSGIPVLEKAELALVERGRLLASQGNAEKSLQACNACHGAEGPGEPKLPSFKE